MNPLKRLAITVQAQFNDFVEQIENHEAVAEVALKQFRDNLVNAKLQLKCLERELANAETRVLQLRKEESAWKSRAMENQEADREKALECVRRMKSAALELQHVEQNIVEMRKVYGQVSRDISTIERQYNDMKQKHRIMVARAGRADAIRGLDHMDLAESTLPKTFERWEKQIARAEIVSALNSETTDALTEEFEINEERAELEKILASLKA